MRNKQMTSVSCTLQELPEVFKSDDPLVNGQSMTTNPDKLYRLDRHISEVAKWQRTAKTRELINYCQFRLGLIPSCSKPSAQVVQILSNYKTGHLDRIPKNFQILIDCHKELVDKAVQIDARTINKRKETNSMTKTNKTYSKPSYDEETLKRLKVWAGDIENYGISPTLSECSAIKRFQLNGKKNYPEAYSKPLLRVMMKHKDLVDRLYVDVKTQTIIPKTEEQKSLSYKELYRSTRQTQEDYKHFLEYMEYCAGLRQEFDKSLIRASWDSARTLIKEDKLHVLSKDIRQIVLDNFEVCKAAAFTDLRSRKSTSAPVPEQPKETKDSVVIENINYAIDELNALKDAKEPVSQHETESGRISSKEAHITPSPASTTTVPDTLSLLIQLAKKAGATEITIKL